MGQEERYAPLVLQVPSGVRAAGLAGAFVAVRDIESIFYNPAQVGVLTGSAVGMGRFASAATLGTLAASTSLGAVSVGIGAQFLDFGPLAPDVPVPSRALSARGGVAGASTAGTIAISTTFKGYRWGLGLKYVEERLGNVRDGSPAADLGVVKDGWTGLISTVALSVQNLGGDIELASSTARLPLRASLGATGLSRPVGPLDVSATLVVSALENGFVGAALGTEWTYSPLEGYVFVARAGVRRPELREQRPVALGATFTADRFSFDYAWEPLRDGTGYRLAIRVR
jgi:hypothetical protein